MKAVILCAGEGERLKPYTEQTAKPLVFVNQKPILSYVFNSLPDELDDIFIIIQEKHKSLFESFLQEYPLNKKVNFLIQNPEKLGSTYYALMTAYEYLKDEEKFLVLNGDDIFLKEDLESIISQPAPTYGLSYKKLDGRYRTCDLDTENKIITSFRRQTKEEEGKELVCFSGALTLTKDFFSYEPVYVGLEAGVPHTLFANSSAVHYLILKEWIQINTLEDLALAQRLLIEG
ncbi:MAG: NDP-sugar synthase [Patescibacteria group bacterium]